MNLKYRVSPSFFPASVGCFPRFPLFLASGRFSTIRCRSAQDVHREDTVSSCGAGGFGCRVLSTGLAFRVS